LQGVTVERAGSERGKESFYPIMNHESHISRRTPVSGQILPPRRPPARWKKPASFAFGAFLSMFFVVEGLIVKSSYFVGNDPVLAHYLASSMTCVLAGFILLFSVGLKNFSFLEGVLLLSGFAWSFASSIVSGQQSNLMASVTFSLSVLMSFVFVPRLMLAASFDTIKFLRTAMGVVVVLSTLAYILPSGGGYESVSGRFNGAAISVAVAANIFFLATVFFGYGVREKSEWWSRMLSLLLLCLSFAFLFLTYTRTLLVEAAALLLLVLFTSQRGKIQFKTLVAAAGISLVLGFLALLYLVINDINIPQLMVDFRLADGGSATDSRMGNWLFGIERIGDAPWFGEGMLTKQTAGGGELELDAAGSTYNVLYDPHSLPLSLGVQAGIPFAIVMMALLLWVHLRYVLTFGIAHSLASVDFMIGIMLLIGMIPGGGDLTSMGNVVDRIYWIILGTFALRTNLQIATERQRRNTGRSAAAYHGQAAFGAQLHNRGWR
jgi:O-Antigen ligase